MSRYLAFLALFGAAPALAAEPRFALEPGLELRYAVKFGNWSDGKDGKPDIPREPDGSPKYQKSDLTVYVLGRQPEGSFRVLMQRALVPAPTRTCLRAIGLAAPRVWRSEFVARLPDVGVESANRSFLSRSLPSVVRPVPEKMGAGEAHAVVLRVNTSST